MSNGNIQISGRLPFTIDIPFISGIKGESSNVEKRLTSLTGIVNLLLLSSIISDVF